MNFDFSEGQKLLQQTTREFLEERVLGLPTEPRVDKDIPFQSVPTGRRDR